MENNQNGFQYTYSAKEQAEIKRIRSTYKQALYMSERNEDLLKDAYIMATQHMLYQAMLRHL